MKYKLSDLDIFNNRTNEILWFLGFFAADGCVSRYNTISISQSGKEGRKRIEFAKEILNVNNKILNTKPPKGQLVHTLQITNKKLQNDLNKFGITPNKSLTLDYPNSLKENEHAAFLSGYIDGDGCVGIYKNAEKTPYLVISMVGTEKFINKVNTIVPVQGNIVHIKRVKNCFDLRWNGRKAKTMGEWLWDSQPCGFKQVAFRKFDFTKTQYFKNDPIRKEGIILIKQGIPCMEISKKLNIAFQTVYKWKANIDYYDR